MTEPDIPTPDAEVPAAPLTPPSTGPATAPTSAGGSSGKRPRAVTTAVVVLLVASLVANVLLARSRHDERDRADVLASHLATVEKELRDLRYHVGGSTGGGESPSPNGPLGGDLGDLLGGLLGGDLGDLGGLLGGDSGGLGDLGSLLGGDSASMLACLGGAGGLGDLLDGNSQGGRADIPDGSLDAQYEGVASWVADERALEFDSVPEPRYVTPEEMTELVRKEVRREYPEETAHLDSDLLAALGAVDPGTDMLELQSDLVGGQVAGYYDPRSGELVVATDDPSAPLTGFAVVAVAHELDHALTDQALHLPVDADEMAGTSDEQMAGTALIEGDASLLMYRFAGSALSTSDQLGIGLDPSALSAQSALADAPAYLASQLQFPYLEGLTFACGLEADGGWGAVDKAYGDPPTTTAQILFPDRYTAGEGAVDPPDPSAPGGSWEPARSRTLGAADLYWLFEAPGDDTSAALDDPLGRAAGWAGGEAVQWRRRGDSAVGMSFVQHDGEAALCESITDWYRAAFPDATGRDIEGGLAFEDTPQDAVVRCEGDNVRVGIAPDLDTATKIAR